MLKSTYSKETIDKKLLTPELKIDLTIGLQQIDHKLYRIIRQFAPFGPGNMTPVFMTEDLQDTGYGKCVGEEKTHLRCTVTQHDYGTSIPLSNQKKIIQ